MLFVYHVPESHVPESTCPRVHMPSSPHVLESTRPRVYTSSSLHVSKSLRFRAHTSPSPHVFESTRLRVHTSPSLHVSESTRPRPLLVTALKTYLFHSTTKIISLPKSCSQVLLRDTNLLLAILWVTIHFTLHNIQGKTTWLSMLCIWRRTNEERDLSPTRSNLRQQSLPTPPPYRGHFFLIVTCSGSEGLS